jgi:hypothetical protein
MSSKPDKGLPELAVALSKLFILGDVSGFDDSASTPPATSAPPAATAPSPDCPRCAGEGEVLVRSVVVPCPVCASRKGP